VHLSESYNEPLVSIFASITAGEVLGVQATSGIRLVETLHEPLVRLASHCHDDVSIDLVVSGGFDERIGSAAVERAPGSVVVRPAGTVHANRYGTLPTSTIVLQCSLTADLLADWPGPSLSSPRLYTANVANTFASRLRAMNLTGSPADPRELSWEVASALAALTHGAPTRSLHATACSHGLVLARETIVDSPHTVDLGVLARHVGLQPSAFTHAFRRRYGCTPSALLRRSRLDRALPLLRDGRLTISEVAARSGFADHAHLSREFRRFVGSSPSTFRRAITT
jgi:AraC family transcriptional regulator